MNTSSRVRTIALGFVLVVGVASASAQITKAGNGYLFRMKFTKGTTSYSVNTTINGLGTAGNAGVPNSLKFSMPTSMTVNSVTKGVADATFKMGPMLVMGRTMPQQSQRAKIDNRGRVLGGNAGAQSMISNLPEKPVAVGQSWKTTVQAPGLGGGTQTVNAVYTFTGIKNVGGKQVAVLNVALTGGTTGKGVTLLSVADGSMTRSTMDMTMVNPLAQSGKPLKASVVVARK